MLAGEPSKRAGVVYSWCILGVCRGRILILMTSSSPR